MFIVAGMRNAIEVCIVSNTITNLKECGFLNSLEGDSSFPPRKVLIKKLSFDFIVDNPIEFLKIKIEENGFPPNDLIIDSEETPKPAPPSTQTQGEPYGK